MSKIRVAVVRGGPSNEYEVSLKTGASIMKHMPEKYHVHDILISKDGVWHRDGFERDPHRALAGIDVVLNAMHGEYGEDGKVQKLLDAIGIPYTGSGALASAIGMNKVLTKKAFEHHGIKSPYHVTVTKDDNLKEKTDHIFHHFYLPLVVKPATSGSSVGVTILKDFNKLQNAIENALKYSDTALIEEYIKGREATCGVVEDFRGEKIYSLLPVEIIPGPNQEFFDHEAKYGGASQEICPGNFSKEEKEEMQRLAKLVHESLNLRHYSRTDFIVTPRRGIYTLEVNTLPGMTNESLLPKSLQAIGCEFKDFLDHLITLARGR